MVIRAGSHEMLVRIALREDPDQIASSEASFGQKQIPNTVKPAVAATSIKRDPPLSSHFRDP